MTEKEQTSIENAIKESLGSGAAVVSSLTDNIYPKNLVDRLKDEATQGIVQKLVPLKRRKR